MAEDVVRLNSYLDRATYERLRRIAFERRVAQREIVEAALRQYLAELEREGAGKA